MSFTRGLFIIKCNTDPAGYLYWNGTAWTRQIASAMRFTTLAGAEKEAGGLSLPRNAAKGMDPFEFGAL